MPVPLPNLGAAEQAFIAKQLALKLPAGAQKRLRFLLHWQGGGSLSDQSQYSGISVKTVKVWRAQFLKLREEHLTAVDLFAQPREAGRPNTTLRRVKDYLAKRKFEPGKRLPVVQIAEELKLSESSVRRALRSMRVKS